MRRFAGAVLAVGAVLAAGCTDVKPAGPRRLAVEPAKLTDFEAGAVSRYAFSQMREGRVPSVAWIVEPQPADLSKRKRLIGLDYGSCSGNPRPTTATLEGTTVVVALEPEPGVGMCGGTGIVEGIVVTLPANARAKTARLIGDGDGDGD